MKTAAAVLWLLSVMSVSAPSLWAADEPPKQLSDSERLQKLEEENTELRRRLSLLEQKGTQDWAVAKSDIPEATLEFLKQTQISGFVSASYTYNFNKPADGLNTGLGFDTQSGQFMINKFTIILQKPVEYGSFEWGAGYFTELIFGQDAAFTQASGLSLGDNGDLEQAYVIFNVPIGYGLKVWAGKYATPMGYELVENEWNANWTSGLQWTLLEPFTHTGVAMSYKFNDKWEAQVLVFNGWDVVVDNNTAISYMGRLVYTPNEKTSITLIGFGGPEQTDLQQDPVDGIPGANGHWREGVDLVATYKLTSKIGSAIQIDYGNEDGAAVIGTTVDSNGDTVPLRQGYAQWWAVGGWLTYDATEKIQLAGRADFLSDLDGARTSQAPSTAPYPINKGMDLFSVTLTINVKPVAGLRIAPEIRWDHSSLQTAYDGHKDQITVGVGAVYNY